MGLFDIFKNNDNSPDYEVDIVKKPICDLVSALSTDIFFIELVRKDYYTNSCYTQIELDTYYTAINSLKNIGLIRYKSIILNNMKPSPNKVDEIKMEYAKLIFMNVFDKYKARSPEEFTNETIANFVANVATYIFGLSWFHAKAINFNLVNSPDIISKYNTVSNVIKNELSKTHNINIFDERFSRPTFIFYLLHYVDYLDNIIFDFYNDVYYIFKNIFGDYIGYIASLRCNIFMELSNMQGMSNKIDNYMKTSFCMAEYDKQKDNLSIAPLNTDVFKKAYDYFILSK